jgi:nitroreductase
MPSPRFVPLTDRFDPGVPPEEALRTFHDALRRRRSIRAFSDRAVSRETIEWLVHCAATAPSGANKQPWRFVCVSRPETKHAIRLAAEEEERAFYSGRASEQWLEDLAPLGTDEDKRYLDIAPWLVVVFKLTKDDDGGQIYYGDESVGIAVGMFLAAAQMAGLATLTHTPSPMRFLCEVLGRPPNERPFVLIPVGYPADDCEVPEHALWRKPLDQVAIFDDA